MKRALPLLHLEHVDLIGALSGTHLQKLEVDGCIYLFLTTSWMMTGHGIGI